MSEIPNFVPEGVIKNTEDAHAVANREKKLREEMGKEIDALAREKEIGLTKEQELNVGVMHYLENKYKNTFEPVVYGREDVARRAIFMTNRAEEHSDKIGKVKALVSTRNGVFLVSSDASYPSELFSNASESLAARIDKKMEQGNHQSEGGWKETFRNIVPEWDDIVMNIEEADLESEAVKKGIGKILEKNEEHRLREIEDSKLPELDELVEGL